MKEDYGFVKKIKKMKMKFLSLFIQESRIFQPLLLLFLIGFLNLISLSLAHAFQAPQQVSGAVIDATTRETLPGVNILVKGTTIGAVSDMEGKFSLEVPGPESVLVVSFIGYLTQEITVGNQTEFLISLTSNAADLDEVVVIGYGTAKKSDLTGSVARIDAENFQNQPMTQLTEMLTGTV